MGKHIAYTVTIPKPCHESWATMTATEKGRFCQACQKEVIDFTKLSDEEMIRMAQGTQGNLCGRFGKTQLNREIYITEYRWNFPFRKDLMLALLALGAVQPLMAQTGSLPKAPQAVYAFPSIKADAYEKTESGVKDTVCKIQGVVLTRETKAPVMFANVVFLNSYKGVVANNEGEFLLELESPMPQNITLKITAVGYESLVVNVTEEEIRKGQPFTFYLSEGVELGGAMVIEKSKRRKKCSR